MTPLQLTCRAAIAAALFLLNSTGLAQAAAASSTAGPEEEEEVITLSPFEVTTEEAEGYSAATTLAGNRLNTELRDIGSAVTVVTGQFLADTGAVNNETLLQYTVGTEVGNVYGNFTGLGDGAQLDETAQFANPNKNTRVRGLTSADNTRDYFITDIPWDGYNVDRVDLQRGANSILFGQGSPAGIINNGTKQAAFRNSGEVEVRIDQFGTARASLDINRELLDEELAVRVALLRDNQKYKQEPAFSLSERLYGALRWEPGFLKKGGVRTIFRANFEDGDIESNRPRSLPPGDRITPWFLSGTYEGRYDRQGSLVPGTDPLGRELVDAGDVRVFEHLNRFTTNSHLSANDNFYRPGFAHGLIRPAINGGPFNGFINPYYNPWIGSFSASQGGPLGYYADANTGPDYWVQEVRGTWGINSAGESDRGVGGFDFHRLAGIETYSNFARNAQLPFAEFGVYKDNSLTDPTVFDFYNSLLDGPNKNEWQDFSVYNLSLAQTFFNEKFGVELTYNAETYRNGQLSLLTGSRQAIYVDINTVYADGTNTGIGTYPDNIPFEDGTPNPNLGRPFISDNGANDNRSFLSDRESTRATAFFTHDFVREGQGSGWLSGLLGKHTLTGLWAEDEQRTDERNWMRYVVRDPAYRAFLDSTAKFNEGQSFVPSLAIYLGPSLLDSSTASGANILRPTTTFTLPSGTMRIFDSHWAHPLDPAAPGYVDPAAEWLNDFYPPDQIPPDYLNARVDTQAENPANYVGWVDMPLNITDSEAVPGNRDLLTTSARLRRAKTTSKALVWQGHLLNKAIVGTYGWREDRAQGWSRSVNTDSPAPFTHQYGFLNLDPDVYKLPEIGSDIEEISRSWSVVVHFDELPGLDKALEKFPLRVSAFYNDSSNFQPEALRVDVLGEQIPLPQGETKDYGLLFQSRDGKYSFRITKYETVATFANSSGLSNAEFIGNSQAWGANWTNHFQYDLAKGNQPSDQIITSQANNRPAGSPNPPGYTDTFRPGNPDFDETNNLYNYSVDVGETLEQALAREAAAVSAWRAWQDRAATEFPGFYEAWGIDLEAPFRANNPQGVTATAPNGFALTEDSVSKGYEFEFSAQPTRNWRITVNAAKTEATRKNIGGTNLANFISAYQEALQGPAGDLRIWWGGAGNETALFQWFRNVGGEWAQRKLQEDTNVPELREWRVNAVTNYDFTEGRLKGLSVGGGVRWQDEVVIGYRPIPGATARDLSFDIANPYMGPAETNWDFWIGYSRALSEAVTWRIQFNIRNAFQDDDLIPITTQPDGTPATYRIAPPRFWTVTNTVSF